MCVCPKFAPDGRTGGYFLWETMMIGEDGTKRLWIGIFLLASAGMSVVVMAASNAPPMKLVVGDTTVKLFDVDTGNCLGNVVSPSANS